MARSQMLIVILLLALGLSACGARPTPSSDKMIVAVSIAPLADFARQVGGARVQVELLVPPGASPHIYEPTPSQLVMLNKARVLVLNGVGLEYWADKVIQAASNPHLLVVKASDGLEILAGDEHDVAGNPHVWLSPLNAIHQVENIRDALSNADPAGAEIYRANADEYAGQLRRLHEELLARSRGFSAREFITFHAAWDYFARDYGLKVAAVVETTPGKEPSPAEIAAIVETARRIHARAIFAEPQFSPKAAEVIASESGAQVLFLNYIGMPPDYSYPAMMRANFQEIERALK